MRLLAPFVLIILALVATVYLDDTPADADLVFVNRGDVFTLDPQRQSYLQDFRMTYALFEGLVRWNNHSFQVTPAVADRFEVSDDRLVYTFHLRTDARWSNGAPVTAHDFSYSWMRLLLPDTAADYSNLLFCIDGSEAFWAWRSERLADRMVDPWSAEDDVLMEQVSAFVRRARRAMASQTVMNIIGSRADAVAIAGELSRLEAALQSGDVDLLRALVDAVTFTRDFDELLHESDVQEAEVNALWKQTADTYRHMVGIQTLDDHTIVVKLSRPTAYFLDLVSFGVCYPVYRPCVEGWNAEAQDRASSHERGWMGIDDPPWDERRWAQLNNVTGRFEQLHLWARPGRLISNGPFVLTEWRYKRDMRLERNEQYHSPQLVKPDSVVAVTIEDSNTRVLAFESGKLDWLSEVGADYEADMLAQVEVYKTHHAQELASLLGNGFTMDEALGQLPPPESGERRNVRVFPTFGTDFYSFNCRPTLSDGRPNPLANPAVRRAFALAVDKEAIVSRVTRLNEPVATTLIPRNSIPGYTSPAGLPYDLDRARSELASAGWIDRDDDGLIENEAGETFPIIDLLWTTNTPRYKWISLELKAQWERELGVQVVMRGTDTKFYKEDLKQGKFMIARGRWYGDYGDPTTFLDLCRTDDGNNDRKYSSPIIDGLLHQAAEEPDAEQRMQILHECERILVEEDMPMLVLCQLVQVYMYEPGRLKGLTNHPRLVQYLWQMESTGS